MAKFILSAFSDEYSQDFDEQIKGLKLNGVGLMEIRGVNGKNISEITPAEAKELKAKLDANGLAVGAMGSPIGKIKLTDDFSAHLDSLRRIIELSHIFGTDRIRVFSFYMPKDKAPEESRCEVMDRLGQMLNIAKAENILLCHENEKGIYGEVASRCLDIQKTFGGEIKCVFDHANFILCGDKPYPEGFELLSDYIYYMHIKDATFSGQIWPAGKGEGRIPETIKAMRKYDREYVLTVEPHLRVFSGLDKLEGTQKTRIENRYDTSAEAFKAAVDAIKTVLSGN